MNHQGQTAPWVYHPIEEARDLRNKPRGST
jgi:hypothetical protein